MVHMSYVPPPWQPTESIRDVSQRRPIACAHSRQLDTARDTEEGGPPWDRGQRTSPRRLRRRREDDERGAELIEFAIVVVLLITLLYGIVTYGLILAAQATITQSAADAARSGIVTTSTAVATAEAQAVHGHRMDEQEHAAAPRPSTPRIAPSPNPADVVTAFACRRLCPSNTANTCLKVTVTYNYSSAPLFPELPGLSVITPSTISSTNILQISTPTGS